MKNKGFTLAEVLITLGIIGVIAALTLPGLMTNAARAKIGPELASAVSTLSEGARMFMDANNADYLSLAMTKAGLTDTKVNTLLTEITNSGSPFYFIKAKSGAVSFGDSKTYAGADGGLTAAGTEYQLANKAVIAAETADCALSAEDSECGIIFYTSSAYATKSDKLRTGVHVFKLFINNRGEVYGDKNWSTTCDDAGMAAATSTGAGCSGRIEAKGWKVDYK